MRRVLAKFLSFDEVVGNAKSVVENLMRERRYSYMRGWVERFGHIVELVPRLVK